jgi:hypothetical protein
MSLGVAVLARMPAMRCMRSWQQRGRSIPTSQCFYGTLPGNLSSADFEDI